MRRYRFWTGLAGVVVLSCISLSAHPITVESAATRTVSFPAGLAHLPITPVGMGAFGLELVFPQFTLDGNSSVDVYDTQAGTLKTYHVPGAVQGQFAYSTVDDTAAGMFWMGTRDYLVGFNVANHMFTVVPLPAVEFAEGTIGSSSPANVLGLTVDKAHNVWITRDHEHAVTRFNPVSGVFTEYALPAGVVPRAIAVLGMGKVVVNVYHADNPHYGGLRVLDAGYLVVDLGTGTIIFHGGFTPTVSAAPDGSALVDRANNLERVGAEGGNQSISSSFSLMPRPGTRALNEAGGVDWIATGKDLIRMQAGTAEHYAVAQRCGVDTGFHAPGGAPAGGTACLFPDLTDVTMTSDGKVWVLAAGYSAIGFAQLS